MWDDSHSGEGVRFAEELEQAQWKEEEVFRKLQQTPVEKFAASLLAFVSLPLKTLRMASWPLRTLLR
eukprot:767631-Hanusia_phi.AAC.4